MIKHMYLVYCIIIIMSQLFYTSRRGGGGGGHSNNLVTRPSLFSQSWRRKCEEKRVYAISPDKANKV